jgi:DNA-binding NarL/FixJ family response regulator
MSTIKKILICDDHSLFGEGVKEILSNHAYEVTVVSSSERCVQEFENGHFDVFLCDLNIDKVNGFELFESLSAFLIDTNVFLLTAYHEDFLVEKAKKMGFNGFLTKEMSTEDFINAIEMELGAPFFSALSNPKNKQTIENTKEFSTNTFRLSKQEKEIIKLIAKGKTSKEIGEILFISKTTADTHRRNISRKLEINSIGALINFAHENNLCD